MSTYLDEETRLGLEFYTSELKFILEPDYTGQTVAIHAESRDYVVAVSSGAAMRAMLKLHPDGPVLLHTIGPVVTSDLADRMLGSRIVSQSR